MIRVSLGWGITADKHIDYMIWLLERDIVDDDIIRVYDKIWVAEFPNEEDAIAFKLRFGL